MQFRVLAKLPWCEEEEEWISVIGIADSRIHRLGMDEEQCRLALFSSLPIKRQHWTLKKLELNEKSSQHIQYSATQI